MAMIKGITVVLVENVKTGEDPFHAPIYKEVRSEVKNVLVSPASSDDIISAQDLYGKKAVYTLAIPKEDKHNWEDCKVQFFEQTWKSFGIPLEGIEALIPLDWNKKVMVERYG